MAISKPGLKKKKKSLKKIFILNSCIHIISKYKIYKKMFYINELYNELYKWYELCKWFELCKWDISYLNKMSYLNLMSYVYDMSYVYKIICIKIWVV